MENGSSSSVPSMQQKSVGKRWESLAEAKAALTSGSLPGEYQQRPDSLSLPPSFSFLCVDSFKRDRVTLLPLSSARKLLWQRKRHLCNLVFLGKPSK